MKAVLWDAERWLRMVIDPTLVPERLNPVCTRSEFEDRDTVRYKWVANSRSIMVAQTGTIFALELRAQTGKSSDVAMLPRLEHLRGIANEVFVKTGERRDGQGERVPIPNLNKVIVGFAFKAEHAKEMSGEKFQLRGRSRWMQEAMAAGEYKSLDNEHLRILDAKENQDWVYSQLSWTYWFRNVNWFADEERLVIYFLKTEGGPFVLSFNGTIDKGWFQQN
jgi:hypothetical protein